MSITQKEKEQIKQEILNEIEEKLKGKIIRENTQAALKETREKWFNPPGDRLESPMFAIFGTITYWQVWELVRKLTCYIYGVNYVRELENTEDANKIAETLCQVIYDLRIKKEPTSRQTK